MAAIAKYLAWLSISGTLAVPFPEMSINIMWLLKLNLLIFILHDKLILISYVLDDTKYFCYKSFCGSLKQTGLHTAITLQVLSLLPRRVEADVEI